MHSDFRLGPGEIHENNRPTLILVNSSKQPSREEEADLSSKYRIRWTPTGLAWLAGFLTVVPVALLVGGAKLNLVLSFLDFLTNATLPARLTVAPAPQDKPRRTDLVIRAEAVCLTAHPKREGSTFGVALCSPATFVARVCQGAGNFLGMM